MKIAVVTEDGHTISQHFGRAPLYVVITVENGKIVAQEQRSKVGHQQFAHEHHHDHHAHDHESGEHQHGTGQHAHGRHAQMGVAITDCEAVLARGMGAGAYHSVLRMGIRPVVTDIASIEEAVMAYVEGRIVDHTERLH